MLPANFFKIEKDPCYISGKFHGKAEGRVEGRAEGRAEGIIETSKKVAIRLKNKGVDLQIISETTELPIEEIKML
jgi:predicted transposase/invertase (TIGR01784 family)